MEKILFDPGYSTCLFGISDSVEFMYSAFEASYMPLKQKKFQFSVLIQKIKSSLKRNISFYLGCLLWASYIKCGENKEIENNPCLNEEYNEEVSLEEINYLVDFVRNKLNRDSKYYLNKPYEPDERYLIVLETYINFIKGNKGFVQTKTTDDIYLPKNIKPIKKADAEIIKTKIENAISKKDLTLLFDLYGYIL